MNPQEFAAKWRHATLKERSAYQSHFNDLCRLVNHSTPVEIDPHGDFFTFEAGARKLGGEHGFADVWYKGHFAWEYKGKHANLEKAYQQLLQYRESLDNPPLLVVSDIDTIEIHTNFTNTPQKIYTLGLEELLQPEKLEILRALFFRPESLKAPQTTAQVTEQAAAHFSELAQLLYDYGEQPDQIAHFLIRLLFCLFAEDAGLLPANIFTDLVRNTRNRPKAFNAQLTQLFAAMSTGGWFGPLEIKYFDGHLFDDAQTLDLDSQAMEILNAVSHLDWSSIEPSIFGTLFERSLDPGKRSQLGAHYTSKEDILLIVEPVLMQPLRREWEEIRSKARYLANRRADSDNTRSKNKHQKEIAELITAFARRLAQVQVLDPACGSGNFLYVSLRQLLDLWKEVSLLAGELGLPYLAPMPGEAPSPEQLHGIEINAYAHQLAQATIWIGYIQWLHENGFGDPPEPILRPLDNILQMDAIMAYDEQGKPVEPVWPKADVIIGNPPFLGDKKMRGELGDKYVNDLRDLFLGRVPGGADLVIYWFSKAVSLIAGKHVDRVGLLSTQAIRGGANRTILDEVKRVGDIFWAYSDHDWILDGANVHVSMVGFDLGIEKTRSLDGNTVSHINSDLTSNVDITKAIQLQENKNLCFLGVMKAGPFEISLEIASDMLKAPLNPNGRPNSDVIKRRIGAQEIPGNSLNLWIIDFVNMSKDEASLYEMPFQYVVKNIKPIREKNNNRSLREKWWLHGRYRPEMRRAIQGLSRYIGTPEVSKYRLFVWMDKDTIPDHTIHVIARSDDYFFGILHSIIHEIWSRNLGTQLRDATSGFRYTSSTTFETFPFPWPPGQEPMGDPLVQAIAEAARELVTLRDKWLNPPGASAAELKKRTLTNLYNQRPTWLELAHEKLDQAVFDAYGWPHDLSEDEILERLLTLNLERAKWT